MRHTVAKKTSALLLAGLCFLGSSSFAQGSSKIAPAAGVKIEGAASVEGTVNHKKSPYFIQNDYFNMKSTQTLTLLERFKTYQQTQEYTCGPAAALMVQEYFGKTGGNEMQIAKIANTSDSYGTNTVGMVNYFQSLGWKVQSSLDGDKEMSLDTLKQNLKKGIPTMVEWVDWGGHWQVVIGYDDMGTVTSADDVLIFADPYDTSDHLQDGYYTYPAERFFYMWLDANLFPRSMSQKQWVTAVPASFEDKAVTPAKTGK